ncbi:MAG: ABC transporter ATP-binding protein [Gemmatimonadaceae bacterium]
MTSQALEAKNVVKRFGSVVANRDASLSVAAGEIHAVVGENGAGKSTLMRMLAGLFPPDRGSIHVGGRDVTGWSTRDAIQAGVGMVHQHFMLVPTLTVAENLVLGREITSGWRLDRKAANAAVQALCDRTGLHVDPTRPVSELSVGEAQRVEILKVLYRGAKILILDEPTAVLSPPEVREFWKVLRTLKAQGDTVIVITHKLDEVVEISDTVTVMRGGETVGRLATGDATPSSIARMMVGRDVVLAGDVAPAAATPVTANVPPVLTVSNLVVASARRPREVDGVSFDVRPGEIFGIAGVEGNGQTELIEAIAGLRRPVSGSVRLNNADMTSWTVRQRIDAGLSHIPEDRHRRGLVLDYSIAENLVFGLQHRYSSHGVMERDRIRQNAGNQVAAYDIRPTNVDAVVRTLSGGNQQKVVISREMGGDRDFKMLLAIQPTRGVDVGAIEFIHAQLRAARERGTAILLVSADLVEVLALADRIAVMYEGRFVTTLPRQDASADVLGPYMMGAQRGTVERAS